MADENKNINSQNNQYSHNPNYGSNADREDELEKLKKQAEEYLAGWKRAKADYLNLKKEMESQGGEIKEWMSKIMILPLLAIIDGFEKAFSEIPERIKDDLWVKGIEGIKKQFEDYLTVQRVEPLKAKGERFDPAKHEAIESAGEGESGVVAEELQKGYLINGEVLRPAKVKVYK